MRRRLGVLLAGRSREQIAEVEPLIRRHPGVELATRLISNGSVDPLHDVATLPDALVFAVSAAWQQELAALGERPPSRRPPVLVVGPRDDPDLMRGAMRAGARDYLSLPLTEDDLTRALEQLIREHYTETAPAAGHLTAVMNAKGGSGGTVVACNVARTLAGRTGGGVLLLDLDVQFGAVPVYFDLTVGSGLVKALELVDSLDAAALEGYLLRHSSGLRILAADPESLLLPGDVPEGRMEQLLQVLVQSAAQVVVDLPRLIDPATIVVLERADTVLVVVQQTLAHLRDARRLVTLLRRDLHLPDEAIRLVVNRYDKQNAVGLKEVREAVGGLEVETLPNDYPRVSESVNLGVPLLDLAPKAAVTRRLAHIAERLVRRPEGADTGRGRQGWSLLGWMRS
jgi:pilus assembly protein CpaE